MSELSGFWTTTGAPAGHQQASYTQAHWSTAGRIMSACSGFEGVSPGLFNQLAVTYQAVNHCHLDTGAGMVDGKWYVNDDASQAVAIDSATAGHYRIDRIVLLCDWAAFTVTVQVRKNEVEDAVAPVLTAYGASPDWTVTGGHYAILLYQARVTDGGVVTLTDERSWATHPVITRQGGDAAVWYTAGTTNYVPGRSLMQVGSIVSGNGVDVTLVFPVQFGNTPIVQLNWEHAATGEWFVLTSTTATNFVFSVKNAAGNKVIRQCNWIAIGPAV